MFFLLIRKMMKIIFTRRIFQFVCVCMFKQQRLYMCLSIMRFIQIFMKIMLFFHLRFNMGFCVMLQNWYR